MVLQRIVSTDSQDLNRCVSVSLSMNEANKGGNRALKANIGNIMEASGKVTRCGFGTDISVTKKEDPSAGAVFHSLQKELQDDGIYKITSITCDWVNEGAKAKAGGKKIDCALLAHSEQHRPPLKRFQV